MPVKLAIPTDDGETVSRHFGQAKYFRVLTLEEGQVTQTELRPKASHQHGDHSQTPGVHPGQQMVNTISDCQVLICGGMGTPAHSKAVAAGLKVILTGQSSVAAAAEAYAAGKLEHDPRLIHSH